MAATWARLITEAAAEFAEAGIDAARNDAEWLAAEVAGVSRGRLLVADPPDASARDRFAALVARRVAREPLQHILGSAPFWRRDLAVGPGVFIPRPETELLVEWALSELAGQERPVVVDLCAGSGAIASAVATERPDATIYAVERHEAAAMWTSRNLTGGTVVVADATDPATLAELDGTVDAVLSNPPYVPLGTGVEPEVAADPETAVFGGADGLAVIRPLVQRIRTLLTPGGFTAVEHDDTHGEVVPELLNAAGFVEVAAHRDLVGRPRFATGRKPI
ncbi:release factor glutamine methyltransferase [Stackebrandtia endophytica]|uniref:Release factor glutamine methyltransferase n=1 Tax=Stackebrandtia endophytica TaxID=1496996 RepID=A0A543B0A5_9ACTN|nr:peptide chain release factor N(5)-glutamine methyltransferase [Stackebrandtia endophytica]TQL78271.1 release factor glutamine methyltransferase [Stackebrandtia endophytica]